MICVEDENENNILQQFKAKTSDLNPDDITCLRFLRAREHNLEKAEDMYRKSHHWRQENDICSFAKWIPPKVLADYGITLRFTGYDSIGRPVVFLPLGKYNAKDLLIAGHKQILIEFTYHTLETLMNLISQTTCSQCVVALDMEELSMRQLLHMEGMQTLYSAFQNLEQNYPEILKHLLIMNAPWIFSIGFNFIKPILSKHTISKIQIYNSDRAKWVKAFLDIMPKETIPEEYFK